MNAYNRVLDAFRDNGLRVLEKGNHTAQCQAPGHSGLEISVAYNGNQALVYAFNGMELAEVLDGIGLTTPDLFDHEKGVEYSYDDGRVVFRTPDKEFYQSGNTKGDTLYHATTLTGHQPVYVVGGEKDVHTLEYAGVTATCNAGGESNIGNFDLTPLYGRKIVVVRDKDPTGEKFAEELIRRLAGKSEVTVVHAKAGKDASDHIAAGFAVEDFVPDRKFDRAILVATLTERLTNTDDLSAKQVAQLVYRTVDSSIPDEDSKLMDWADLSEEWWDAQHNPDSTLTIPLPWPELNDVLAGGLKGGCVYLIGGRPSGGKSLGLSNIASYASHHGYHGILYSVEMGRLEIASRIISAGSHVDYRKITTGELDEDSLEKIAQFTENSKPIPLKVNDYESLTVDQIVREARREHQLHGLHYIAVDYMQLLKLGTKAENRQQEISGISRTLKMLAKELNIAVVAAVQLNRGNAQDQRPPRLEDLRESGSLEQDCDVAILLHHPSDDGIPTGEVEFILGKNRSGERCTIILPWRANIARIG